MELHATLNARMGTYLDLLSSVTLFLLLRPENLLVDFISLWKVMDVTE
jgi:hypothetical protein